MAVEIPFKDQETIRSDTLIAIMHGDELKAQIVMLVCEALIAMLVCEALKAILVCEALIEVQTGNNLQEDLREVIICKGLPEMQVYRGLILDRIMGLSFVDQAATPMFKAQQADRTERLASKDHNQDQVVAQVFVIHL